MYKMYRLRGFFCQENTAYGQVEGGLAVLVRV